MVRVINEFKLVLKILVFCLGPNTKANVMLLRGLTKHFKTVVWYRFNNSPEKSQKMDKEELFYIIRKVENCGYHVISVSTDGGQDNQTFAKDLGITKEHPKFSHPYRQDCWIFWFFDPPHLLKLAR